MRYFREFDPDHEETRFYEFKGDWVNRQLLILPELTLLLKRGEQSEASLKDHQFGPGNEITPQEFKATWERHVPVPHGTTRLDHPLVVDFFASRPGPTTGNITTWTDGFFKWDPRLDSCFARLEAECRSAQEPDPKTAPTTPSLLNLSAIYKKDVAELTQRDLLVLTRWIRPWLQNDINALRFFLPHLVRFYWARRAGADLELTLLLYQDHLSSTERQLITQVALKRVQETYWAWDCVFALFWCEDLSEVEKPFRSVHLPVPGSDEVSMKPELWCRLRDLVAEADNPVRFLWDGQYDVPKELDFVPRLQAKRGLEILKFLQEVGWISYS